MALKSFDGMRDKPPENVRLNVHAVMLPLPNQPVNKFSGKSFGLVI